jgi:tetratricopeptide (TPR) repeat protein
MGEPIEEPESETREALDQAEPAALAMALGRRGKGGKAIDAESVAYLRDQRRLINLQAEHLHEQRELVLSRLRLGRWKDRVTLALQAMTAALGLAIAVGVGWMAWSASQERGLTIEPFSVPPDLARDGLTGQVAAARFLDKLQALQAATVDSDRPAQSFQNNWESEIKVEIPETGLTFGEFERLLRETFGHISHVSGEVLRTPAGIALTARIGDQAPQTFTGDAAGFDALAQKAAEAVFRASQPYRFAEYLDQHDRAEEAFQVISDLATRGPASERGWAYALWSLMDVNDHGDISAGRRHAAMGLGYGPASDIEDEIAQASVAVWSGHEEVDLRVSTALEGETQKRQPDSSPLFFEENRKLSVAWLAFIRPDYRASAPTWLSTAGLISQWTDAPLSVAMAASADALDHDPAAARRLMAMASITDEIPLMPQAEKGAFPALPTYWLAVEAGDWRAALADARRIDGWLEANKARKPSYGLMQQVWIWPLEALAQARTGDLAGAQALIGRTPGDCYLCLRVRGQIAARAGDWPAAERWFAEAVRQGPSLPFAELEWAHARLQQADPDGAIRLLARAHAKATRFADPLELWGEALLAKGERAGAAGKFAEADMQAPTWGRNHLMWGQALMLAGRYREARAQFEAANGLELAAPDRAALNLLLARTAKEPLHG